MDFSIKVSGNLIMQLALAIVLAKVGAFALLVSRSMSLSARLSVLRKQNLKLLLECHPEALVPRQQPQGVRKATPTVKTSFTNLFLHSAADLSNYRIA